MKLTLSLGVLSGSNLLLMFAANVYVLYVLGAGSSTDAFFGSLVIPQLVAGILATPLVGSLLPQLAGESEDRIRRRGWAALLAATVVLGSLGMLLAATSRHWVAWILPGFASDARDLTASLSAIQMTGMVFTSWLAVVTLVCQAKKRFIVVEFAELVANLGALAALAAFMGRQGLTAAAWVFAARPLLASLLLMPLLGLPGLRGRESNFIGELWRGFKAPLFGSAYVKSGFLVDRLLCSLAPPGFLSLYHLADKLVAAGVDVIRSSMITPVLPTLTEQAKSGQWTDFASFLRKRLLTIAGTTGAASVLLVIVGLPLANLVAGSRVDDARTLWAFLVALQGQLVAGSLAVTLAYGFYALRDTSTPARVTMVATTLGILIKISLFPVLGLLAVAGATSFLQCFNTAVMGAKLRNRMRRLTPAPELAETRSS